MHYCVSDIHGCFKAFEKLLETINFSQEDTLYILGDVLDRGEEVLPLLNYIQEHENIILLKGNHEAIALNCLYNFDISSVDTKLWGQNGGDVTLDAFMNLKGHEKRNLLHFLNNLKTYIEVDAGDYHYLLVHGGFDTSLSESVEEVKEDELLWYRGPYLQKPYFDKVVVSGHIPTLGLYPYFRKSLIFRQYDEKYYDYNMIFEAMKDAKESNIINLKHFIYIDGGCVFGHKLACLRLEDQKTFYVQNR